MERILLGKRSLMIAMARHIKASKKKLKESNITKVTFNVGWFDKGTEIVFKDNCYGTNEVLSFDDARELINEAFRETASNGVFEVEGHNCTITLFGKPVKPFRMLQRLIQKYSGVDIAWDYCKCGEKFLCYNESVCEDGIEFIKKTRTSNDILRVNYIYDFETGLECSALKLSVETPHGKVKGEITLIG